MILLFVHGTGVRGPHYAATLRTIQEKVRARGWAAEVKGCFWGASHGASFALGGKSIPGYDESGGGPPSYADEMMALWAVLYTDPWYELRLLRDIPVEGSLVVGAEPPAAALRRSVDDFVPSESLKIQLAQAGLDENFDAALDALRKAPEFSQAIATAPADPLEHRRAIARALVAHALVTREEQGEPPLDGATRGSIVERVTEELNGYGLDFTDFIGRHIKGLAARMITSKLTGDRGSISDAAAPMAGDVLRFLARGDGARKFLRQSLADLGEGPVVVIGHSLGGIMCVDLLAREAVAQVSSLVTVGSQSPFLYEIGAFPGLEYPAPLPNHFPRWLNIYDRRDILSYIGSEIFGDRVTDVLVDNGEPFPTSHSAYWANERVWDAIEQVMP